MYNNMYYYMYYKEYNNVSRIGTNYTNNSLTKRTYEESKRIIK